LVVGCSLALGHCSLVHADTFSIGTLERRGVTIKDLKGDVLQYDINGRTSETQASKVTRLNVVGETPLNDAEEAYAASRWDAAVDAYQRVLRTGSKPWIKDWAAMRLIDAAGKSGRFDAAAAAYVQMLLRQPELAATMKPAMPDAKSTFLTSAVSDVNAALNDPKLTPEQRQALLQYLIELHRARGDQQAALAAYQQLSRIPGVDESDPAVRQVLADARLSAAGKALGAGNYRQAIAEIEDNKAAFVEPKQQAEALYILAAARAASAGTDKTALQDAALAYMRVVTVARNDPAHPHLVESLLKTAELLKRLDEPASAAKLYQQVVTQYPDDPGAAQARSGLEQLNGNEGRLNQP
jgi:TolA-binding protein